MTLNEMLEGGVVFRSVFEVYRVEEPDADNPYGKDVKLWTPPAPEDLTMPVDRDWADRDVASVWPMHDVGYPMLQIEVR